MPETAKTLIDEIKQVIEITSRVDERVKMIAESQRHINERLNTFIDQHNLLVSRVHVLETVGHPTHQKVAVDIADLLRRVQTLEEHKQTWRNRVKAVFGYIGQGAFIILVCYLLYRLGLSTPPVP